MNNLTAIELETLRRKRLKAQERDNYYEVNSYVIENDLKNQLENHNVSTSTADNTLALTVGSITNSFLEAMCSVYDRPPHISLEAKASKQDKNNFRKLLDSININRELNSNLKKMKLHNTIITKIGYNHYTDKIFIDNSLNEGNTRVWTFVDDYYNWEVIAYEIELNDEICWTVYDRILQEQYILDIEEPDPIFYRNRITKRITGKKAIYYTIDDNNDFNTPDFNPYIIYREKKQSEFFGYGFNELIAFVKSLNLLLSVTNRDSITETLRYAVANFKPKGNRPIKAGASEPLYSTGKTNVTATYPKIDITSADLYNEDISNWIKTLFSIITDIMRISNPFAKELRSNMSGVALKIYNEPKIDNWHKDVALVKAQDIELIKNICLVNNLYNKKNYINPSAFNNITITYRQPSLITDEIEEYKLFKEQVKDGNVSPLQWIINNSKGLTEPNAIEKIKENLLLYKKLFGSE